MTTPSPYSPGENDGSPCTVNQPIRDQASDPFVDYLANFRRFWREHLIHLAVGALSGALLLGGEPWAGAVIMATVWVRQALEFQKRRDTPGIDLSYHLAGLLAAVVAGTLIDAWSLGG